MSNASKTTAAKLPGFFRTVWLLLMQPSKFSQLLEQIGLGGKLNLWKARHHLRNRNARDEDISLFIIFVTRLMWVAFAAPVAIVGIGCIFCISFLHLQISWPEVLSRMSLSTGLVAILFLVGDARSATVWGLVWTAVWASPVQSILTQRNLIGFFERWGLLSEANFTGTGVLYGIIWGVLFNLEYPAPTTYDAKKDARDAVVSVVPVSLFSSLAIALTQRFLLPLGWKKAFVAGLLYGVSLSLPYLFFALRIPVFCFEAILMLRLSYIAMSAPQRSPHLVRLLPLMHDELIYFPLPGLRGFLITLGEQEPELALQIVRLAGFSVGQKESARAALIELQARTLENVARHRTWGRAATFELPFFSQPQQQSARLSFLSRTNKTSNQYPWSLFQTAAQDLKAARETLDHRRKRKALERARDTLGGFVDTIISKKNPDSDEMRLLSTARAWIEVVSEEDRELLEEERRRPQVPRVFEPGSPLRREDAYLFKGRSELIGLIDHDLADERRAPLVLTGQRRMGKTSLLHMLPGRLGTGTTVVSLNFQGLSGHVHRQHPHLWLSTALVTAKPEFSSRPRPTHVMWGDTLSWLINIESSLRDNRILFVIDEVERLQTGIEEGWSRPDFLDFLRAAGDELRQIRLLLVSAYPLHRLGRAWTDRVINVVQREIKYLQPKEAEELILNPALNFPDIYPIGGVERIVKETHGHPYLVQFVCDTIVRELNAQKRFKANDSEVERALDRTLTDSVLFRELWNDRTEEERALLRRLAQSVEAKLEPNSQLRELVQQGYVEACDGVYTIAVPLFQKWILEHG